MQQIKTLAGNKSDKLSDLCSKSLRLCGKILEAFFNRKEHKVKTQRTQSWMQNKR